MNRERRGSTQGFTLIEVLVAIAIIAFGLVAVFGQISQTANAASRLREKTLANWVAVNLVTEMRLRGDFPAIGTQSDDVEMANTRWHYEIRVSETASDVLRRADVTVSYPDDPDRPLATAAGFIAEPTRNIGLTSPSGGWPLISPDGEQDETSTPPATPPTGQGATS